jgi:hypothetical protein
MDLRCVRAVVGPDLPHHFLTDQYRSRSEWNKSETNLLFFMSLIHMTSTTMRMMMMMMMMMMTRTITNFQKETEDDREKKEKDCPQH